MILADDWNRGSQLKLLLMAVRQLDSKTLRINDASKHFSQELEQGASWGNNVGMSALNLNSLHI